jgi:asparagine synthase (glutamine-hydrolysing)
MCGIAGYYGTQELPVERIQECLRVMGRRGPDHAGFFTHSPTPGRHVALLHTRLSIIDLDPRANQPFSYDSHFLVYNGELYNYVELRRELAARGSAFVTESDTEVLAHLLAEQGWPGLDKGEGMWAFAWYDARDGSLLLGRDRFGEKPLYLYRDATGFYFGSEIKFLACLAGRRLQVNARQLYRFLVNGYKSLYKTADTFFQNVSELPSGSVLLVPQTGEEKAHRYWTPAFKPDDAMSYADAVEGARAALIRSVKLRLRADVPLAFCMSGGVDSNALISIAKNVCAYDVHGFTIANSDTRYEEQELIDHAVAELGVRHTSIPVDTRDFLPKLRTLVWQHDAPVYTITYFAHWLLMESVAAHGYRIAVSGTAADELFTGYYDHHLAYLYEIRNEPELHAAARRGWMTHVKPIVRNPFLGNPEAFIERPDLRDHIFLNAEGFARDLLADWAEPFTEEHYTDSLLRNRMLNELFHESVPVILHEDDLNAMYFSIENRSPFLDRELFEFCYRIPSRHLIRDGLAKAVLRDAMRGIAPDKILSNPRKVGFNAPIFSFLDVSDACVRGALLDRSPIFDHVRRDSVEALLRKPDLPNSESKFLFYFLTCKMFLEEYAS